MSFLWGFPVFILQGRRGATALRDRKGQRGPQNEKSQISRPKVQIPRQEKQIIISMYLSMWTMCLLWWGFLPQGT
jgi:hypothetical protein